MDSNSPVKNASCVIILYKEDKILLQLRDSNAPTAKNKWSFFGGGIEPEETPLHAVIRETKEELKYDLKNPILVLVRDLQGHPLFTKEYIFLEKYDGSELTLCEGADLGFFGEEEVADLDMVKNKKVLAPVLFDYIDFLESNGCEKAR